MNIAAAVPGDAERAFALLARNVALAPAEERLPALLDAATGLRQHVAAGRLNAVAVSDRIIEVAELHGLSAKSEIGAIARPETMNLETSSFEKAAEAPIEPEPSFAEISADEEFNAPPPLPEVLHPLEQALCSFDPEMRKLEFVRGATDSLKLATSPGARISIIDNLQALGLRIGLPVAEVQGLLAAAASTAADVKKPVETYAGLFEGKQSPLATVRPFAWRGVPLPAMRWIATHRIPADDATILSGDGGGGKTTVALQLAVSVERGLGDWLGTTIEAGPVIFFSAEEPDHEMRRRLVRVARKRGIDPDDIRDLHFHFASPENCLLAYAHADGTMWPTPLFGSMALLADAIRPALIVIDSIAATFGGNQNDRVHARTFVSLFRRLAQDAGCAVLLLDHPSLAGITSGTGRGGSMDWQNATRARLHLETVQGEDGSTGRVLEVKKSNYGPAGEKVKLQWEDGCFVTEGTTPAPALAAAQNAAERSYLDCLDVATSQGRNVFAATGRGYAPNVFAGMPEGKGTPARAFAAAQERLFSTGLIHNEQFGPPSKNSRRIARVRSK